MPSLGRRNCKRQTGGARTHNSDPFTLNYRQVIELSLMAGTWIHKTGSPLMSKNMIQARLITTYTGIDLIGAITARFIDELRISQHGAPH